MKKISYKGKSEEELIKALMEKRVAVREFRFGTAGSKTRDVKASRNAKKEIARIMTELTSSKQSVGKKSASRAGTDK